MKRKRTKLAFPNTPGGFLDNPPQECPNKVVYQPDKCYETVLLVDYARCSAAHCSYPQTCQRRVEEDAGRRQRINRQKNGGGGE